MATTPPRQHMRTLTEAQITHFLTHGYIVIPSCFTPTAASTWTRDVWTRLGMSPTDKTTWTRERTNMPSHRRIPVSEFAPKAWDAICDLIGGEERVDTEKSGTWSDSFIVNLGTEEGEGMDVSPRELEGWHVDGDFFVHFLDSPEQALLVIPLFTDILPNGGGTWICTEGPAKIGKWLYDHPEGVYPHMTPVTSGQPDAKGLSFYNDLIQTCPESSFHEMTGKIGDVILLHPLMLHTASKNGRRLPRIITNPPVSVREPFNFDRGDAEGKEGYSIVELKTIQALGGVEKLKGWKITGERRPVVPARLKFQAKYMEEESRRLKDLGVVYDEANDGRSQTVEKAKGLDGARTVAVS